MLGCDGNSGKGAAIKPRCNDKEVMRTSSGVGVGGVGGTGGWSPWSSGPVDLDVWPKAKDKADSCNLPVASAKISSRLKLGLGGHPAGVRCSDVGSFGGGVKLMPS